ncbi:MAG TPA: M48 family metallopeptidase, partial [Caulobacteraceae bacterium]|nr:M48 family metallopeptidase [Caulobacteraceae bacterium]
MGAVGLQTYIWNNNIRSGLLLAGFPLLLIGMVFAIIVGMMAGGMLPSAGSPEANLAYAWRLLLVSAPAAIAVALVWFLIAWFANQTIIDIATGARQVERADAPELYNLLENLCISRGLKTPTLRIIETDGMNAFASGVREGQFSVTVTRGLLDRLDRDELEAVLGHELTHILNRDVRTMVIAAIFAGIITLICQMIWRAVWWGPRGRGRNGWVFWVVAMAAAAIGSLLAIVIRMAISRTREYVADAGSVELTKNPDAMISALQKVAGHAHMDAPASVRSMFLEDDDEGFWSWFATHPPVEKRIAALERYGGGRVVEQPADGGAAPAQPAVPVDTAAPGPWGAAAEPAPP